MGFELPFWPLSSGGPRVTLDIAMGEVLGDRAVRSLVDLLTTLPDAVRVNIQVPPGAVVDSAAASQLFALLRMLPQREVRVFGLSQQRLHPQERPTPEPEPEADEAPRPRVRRRAAR